MIKRKLLGQHFLNSKSIAELIVKEAEISKNDVVFEIGTGPGILIPLLCENAQKVISVDADEKLIKKARLNFSKFDNLVLKSGDGFNQKDVFSIFVSNLPYSKSKDAIEWLAQNSFSHGVIMVQKEFAEKLLNLNSYFSASGIITFKNSTNLQETFKFLPLDKVLIETDSPFLAPVPNRGKKNEPSFIDYTAQKLADIKKISKSDLVNFTTSNFNKLFFN